MPKRLWTWLKKNAAPAPRILEAGGLAVELTRKPIRNLHLRICPPDGRLRVSAPLRMSEERIHSFITGKLEWIRRHQARFKNMPMRIKTELKNGETVFFLGASYMLRIMERTGNPKLRISGNDLEMSLRPGSTLRQREKLLEDWYRGQLKDLIPPLLAKWETVMGVRARGWNIKRMKTKWGTCNTHTHKIWLNLELAKRPLECLESILIHELAHLIVRDHGPRFRAVLDRYQPNWKQQRDLLNRSPIGCGTQESG